MGEEPREGSATVTEHAEPEQIREEIEQTREELGDTVEALAEKTDVKAQAKQRFQETKAAASEKKEQLLGKAKSASPDTANEAAAQVSQGVRENPLPVAALGAFAVGFLAGRISKHQL